jgi:5-oxoprolinase (ATP-hydrolysing) subunit A
MIKEIDINCDMGESFGNYSFGADREIMPYLSSVNVACGFHGGDPVHMERTVKLASACGVAIGVHWGLPDLSGFGRRRMDLSADEARCITLYQAGALLAFATANGVVVDHWVPHGALYPMLARDETLANAMLDAIALTGIEPIIYCPTPREPHRFYEMARERGFTVVPEIAADLRYRADGSLVIERQKQPQDLSEFGDRLQRFLESGRVATIDGGDLEFEAQAILIHGDGPNALDVARTARSLVNRLGIAVKPASTVVQSR